MPLQIDVLTLFPRMLEGFLAESILGKAIESKRLGVSVHDVRAWCTDKHRTADEDRRMPAQLRPEPAPKVQAWGSPGLAGDEVHQ